MTDHQAITLIRALRKPMPPHGIPTPTNPHQSDEYDQAERQYREATRSTYAGPLPSSCTLNINGTRIPFNHIHPHLIAAQELDRPQRKRSPAAKALTFVLHANELIPHYAIAAKPALARIPVPTPHRHPPHHHPQGGHRGHPATKA